MEWKNSSWDMTPITCRCVNIVVADEPQFKFYWARPYVGKQRQAIEVAYEQNGESNIFFIDNADGMGIAKVNGGAHFRKPHRGLKPQPGVEITEVPDDEVVYPSAELIDAENARIEKDCAALFGDEYVEQNARMKETLKALNEGTFDFKKAFRKG